MVDAVLEALLRRDRQVVLAALLLLAALTWSYLLWLAGHMATASPDTTMADMAMPGMDMGPAPRIAPWAAMDILLAFVMWSVMMVGMMTPSVAPMILLYARVGRHAASDGKPFAATGWFAAGYFLAWTGFSVLATVTQVALRSAALLTPMLTSTSDLMGGVILIVAGVYQWSRLKDACLMQCREPLLFIQRHGGFKRRAMGSLGLGLRHGLYCIGCCWAFMLLLFVGGVMNILWVAALAVLVLLEKLSMQGRFLSRATGCALISGGVFLIYRWLMPFA
jgi:predicted metal-binding membrane protein